MANSIVGTLVGNQKSKRAKAAKTPKPVTAQKCIPYVEVYTDGMIQSDPGVFTKCYAFPEANFKTLSDEEQEAFFERFQTFLNSIESNEHVTFNLLNMLDDIDVRFNIIRMQERNDNLDRLRKEMNDMVYGQMKKSRGNIITKRYITFAIEEDSVDLAVERFKDIDIRVAREFRNLLKEEIHAMTMDERLELLAKIYGTEDSVYFMHDKTGKVTLDLSTAGKLGLTTKDIIAPAVLKFNSGDMQIGEQFAKAVFLKEIANFLSTDFIGNLMDINSKLLLSIDITPIDQSDGQKLVHNKQVLIDNEIAEAQKKALKAGYSPELISGDLAIVKEQITQLQHDMTSRDQRVFYFGMNLVYFADSKEALKRTSDEVKSAANKNLCSFETYLFQQERGFNAALPLGVNHAYTQKRLLTTENMAAFMPFSEVSTFDETGFYYGQNVINKSVIILDRLKGMNYNGLILGTPGSGKSFSAKREFSNVILNSDNEVYIIDPEGEYAPIITAMGGSEIKIAPGNGVHVNPFDVDMDTTYDKEINPLAAQSDFIASICETIMGGGTSKSFNALSTQQRSIVNTCVTQLYKNYLEHLRTLKPDANGRIPTIDRFASPTLQDLWNMLLKQEYPEARDLAIAMQLFTDGAYDTFAHRTNVDITNRLTVFNIRDIGTNLRELGLKVCLNFVWQKMVENRAKGKWTWLYIDEFHLLLSTPNAAETIKTIWKRARKFQGVPTGITQNTEDLLSSPAARTIINTTNFIEMLNQSMMDRENLQTLVGLTDNEIQFIDNVDSGRGIIHIGSHNIPFVDEFPRDTEMYKIMSTKPTDEQ